MLLSPKQLEELRVSNPHLLCIDDHHIDSTSLTEWVAQHPTEVRSLLICSSKLSTQKTKELSRLLKESKQLQLLVLNEVHLNRESFGYLIAGLSENVSLETIHFSNLGFNDREGLQLASILERHPTIKSIELPQNNLTQTSLAAFHHSYRDYGGLRCLNLSYNPVGVSSGLFLAEIIRHNTTLEKLHLSGTELSEVDLPYLCGTLDKNLSLIEIDISYNELGDGGILLLAKTLKSNQGLSTVNLRNTQISNKGAQALGEALKSNKNLRILDLSFNSIEDEGIAHLASGLKQNDSLESFNLSMNRMTAQGERSLWEALTINTTLRSLDLSGYYKTVEDTASLVSFLAASNYTLLEVEGAPESDLLTQYFDRNKSIDDCLSPLNAYTTFTIEKSLEKLNKIINELRLQGHVFDNHHYLIRSNKFLRSLKHQLEPHRQGIQHKLFKTNKTKKESGLNHQERLNDEKICNLM